MVTTLTTGAIQRIMEGDAVEKPAIQILGFKKIGGNEFNRVRLLVSDGQFLNSFAMLATQLNHMFLDGQLTEFTIIRADKYITSLVNKNDTGKRVLIILALTVLQSGAQVDRKIGNPVTYNESALTVETAAATSSSVVRPALSKQSYDDKDGSNKTTLNQSLNASRIMPIISLSPYMNKWVIKVRVISKSPIRTWNNARGEGKLFSMHLMDETGEIRATAFKEQCDKHYDMIIPDKVYFISKGTLKTANKQFCQLNNYYEITFTNETSVQACDDDDTGSIPEIKYNLVSISTIAGLGPNTLVDTIGVCKEVGEMQQFTSRTNKQFKKRELTLVDDSNAAVTLTLWGDEAVNFDGHVQPLILLKGANVHEFGGGKSLGLRLGALMKINPDTPECHKLRQWFDEGGSENITTMVSAYTSGGNYSTDWKSFKEAQEQNLGMCDKADYFQLKGIVNLIKSSNALYKACPDCNKKLAEEGDGYYCCEKCNAIHSEYNFKMLFYININDWSSSRWATVFNDVGEQLLGCSTKDLAKLMEKDAEKVEKAFKVITYKPFILKLRTKLQAYGDIHRNNITVNSISPINYKEYNRYLIKSISQLTGIRCNNNS